MVGMRKIIASKTCAGSALGIAAGMTVLVLLLAGEGRCSPGRGMEQDDWRTI